MGNRCKSLFIAAALFIAPSSAAHAKQMDATDKPTITGPLSRTDVHACHKETERTVEGVPIARFQICGAYYYFKSRKEDNAKLNYGAYWMQVNVDATKRWCARSVKVVLPLPKRTHAKAPRPGTSVRGANNRYTTRLEVDAQGHTSKPAKIKNSFKLRPKRLRANVVSGGDKLRLKWRGRSTRKLGYAAGIELSWRPGGQLPRVVPAVSSRLAPRRGSC